MYSKLVSIVFIYIGYLKHYPAKLTAASIATKEYHSIHLDHQKVLR